MAEASFKTPEKTLTSKINCCHALQTNNVQAMLLQSEIVSEIMYQLTGNLYIEIELRKQ